MYDIIGDIHGYADELEMLLKKLGYENKSGKYSHPERKAIFVGDFIDRGPKIRETLKIVRNMKDGGEALATMGNHEYNALCYNTKNKDGEFLRINEGKNKHQHEETENQFNNHKDEWKSYLEWFSELPLYLDFGEIRVAHASWIPDNISMIDNNQKFTAEYLNEIRNPENKRIKDAIHQTMKGVEVKIPNGYYIEDKDGNIRYEMRIKFWLNPEESEYHEYYFEEVKALNGKKVDVSYLDSVYYYSEQEPMLFTGHYWLKGKPERQAANVGIVDYSVANGDKLAAYRWNGEKEILNENFVWV